VTRKLVIRDLHGQREVPLAGTLTVGRDPACDVFDSDPLLSRRHAQFLVTARGVVVRDLNSQNGVFVNGVRVTEALLQPDDVVQIAHMHLTFIQELEPVPAAAGDDRTVIMEAPPAATATSGQMPTGTDRTRLFVPVPGHGAAAPAAAPLPPPAAAPSAPAPPVPVQPPAAPAPPMPAAAAAPAPAEASGRRPARARVARSSFAVHAMLVTTAVTALVFLAGVLPVLWWHDAQMEAVALRHGEAVVNWLAAQARGQIEQGAAVTAAVEPVLKEPGVVAALVVTPGGRILAPASRASETIARFDGLGVGVGDVYRLQSAWTGDLLEIVRPVEAGGQPRAAIAWVKMRPADLAVDTTGRGAVLAPTFLLSLLLGMAAGATLARRAARAVAQLNEDTELALTGRLEVVGDPLGAKSGKDLANTLNYLIARMKAQTEAPAGELPLWPAGTQADSRPAPAAAASRSPGAMAAGPARGATPAPPVAPPAPPPVVEEARLVASAELKISEATGPCDALLGSEAASLVGQHLFSAFADQTVLDAVLRCLGALPPAGREETVVARAGAPPLRVSVARQGRDEPLTITVRREG
jgi:hypothetical protein